MRVTTVSVKVLLVIVSVTLPGPVGEGGSSIVSGFRIVTVVTDAALPWPVSGKEGLWGDGCLERKWAGIMAWNSSLVIGRGSTCSSLSIEDVGVAFLWLLFRIVGEDGSFSAIFAAISDDEFWLFNRRGAGFGGSWFVGVVVARFTVVWLEPNPFVFASSSGLSRFTEFGVVSGVTLLLFGSGDSLCKRKKKHKYNNNLYTCSKLLQLAS